MEPGYTYEVKLNDATITAGAPHVVNVMDYYDLVARRTQLSDGSVTNQTVRFIVVSSRRGSPELGLIEWTPYPLIPSGPDEFADGDLVLIVPEAFPPGIDIPVVAWVDDGPGNARRVNGTVTANGLSLPLRRGVGHAFLAAANAGSTLNFDARIQTLTSAKSVRIDSEASWQTFSGILPAEANWPAHSRIHVTGDITVSAGNTLTIGPGVVVLLDPSVNITNSGHILINGAKEAPSIFTSQARLAPEQHENAWGGFLLRGTSAQLTANYAIMTGAGASADFSFSPGASHRSEQALLLVHSGAKAFLTNCFLISNAGQIGNGYNSDVTYDHCLLQRAITGGEYEGGTVIVKNSAVIEFPSIDGVYNADIVDSDYDGIYFTTGTHILQDSLFGFAKDDAIDSGSGGAGTVVITNCWVESALHEALAWSGEGRQTWTYDSVLINSGQGIECGWSTGTNSPLCYAERLLSLANSIGARFGDNYQGTTGVGLKTGFLTLTNSILIHNYRDVFGRPWDDTWDYRVSNMSLHDNFLTLPNPMHPENRVWTPELDASRLLPFMRTPPAAKVGIGFAGWTPPVRSDLLNGIPIRLSTFTTNEVELKYTIEIPSGTIGTGTLKFRPGETLKRTANPGVVLSENDVVRVSLHSPIGADITTTTQLLVPPDDTNFADVVLIPFNSSWKYLDDGSNQDVAWRAVTFNDGPWLGGPAQFGYGETDQTTSVRRISASGTTNITFYFRKAFTIQDPAAISSLTMRLLRDDAGVVYLNGSEVFRSSNLPASPNPIDFSTLALSTGENTVDTVAFPASALRPGENVIAVEIHQESIGSSDLSFDLELIGTPHPSPARLEIASFGTESILYWKDPTFHLESSIDLKAPSTWSPVNGAASPFTLPLDGEARFYRLAR